MQSIARALSRRGGRAPGRAPLHLALVGALVAVQSLEIAGLFSLTSGRGVWAAQPLCVGALAASLGFAAAQGRAGLPPRVWAGEQVRVALPPFLFVVLAAAALIGPLATTQGWRAYFADPGAYEYLLNLVGWPRYALPGVFEFNDFSEVVNRNVWVAPFAVAVAVAAGVAPGRRFRRTAPAVAAVAVAVGAILAELTDAVAGDAGDLAVLAARGDGLSALLGGLAGVAAHHAGQRVRLDWRIAGACAAALGGLALVGDASWAESAVFRVLAAAPTAYAALYLSFARLPGQAAARRLVPILPSFFLFSFPIQQLAVDPGVARGNPLGAVAIGAAAALGLAVLFWWAANRRLLTARQRAELADGPRRAVAARARPRWRDLRARMRGAAAPLALGAVLLALCLGLMAMLYVAFLPDAGGL